MNSRAKFFIPTCLLAAFLSACGEELPLNTHFSLSSATTGYNYSIELLQLGSGPVESVFYVTDGPDLLPIIHEELAASEGTSTLFVGIGYPGKNYRTRDLTFSKKGKDTGQAGEFLEFISRQLDQYLVEEELIPANASRGLIGHSLGGLFCSYAFTQDDVFFSKYLIMSPALFWDDYRFFELEEVNRAARADTDAAVYLCVSQAEDFGMNNSYEALKSLLERHYPTLSTEFNVASGSHFKSRNENLAKGIAFLTR